MTNRSLAHAPGTSDGNLSGSTKMKQVLIAVTLSLGLFTQAVAEPGGYVELYNGKNLAGWRTTGNWIAQEGGVLLIRPRPGEEGWQRYSDYLWTRKKYKDFVLELEYSYPADGNSGVFFRVGDVTDPVNTGIEVQILDSSRHQGEMPHHDHGGVIRTVGASENMSKPPGQWNRMIIACKGHHLQVELNGKKIVDLQLDTSAMRHCPAEGFIGLQDHGEPNNIKFRKLRIKSL